MCVCVCVCVRVCVCAWVRVCVCACMGVCVGGGRDRARAIVIIRRGLHGVSSRVCIQQLGCAKL